MSTNPFRSIAPNAEGDPGKKGILLRIVAAATGGLLVVAAFASPALAGQSPTALGSAASFSILAAAAATVPGSTLPGEVGAVAAITDDVNTVYGSTKHLPNDAATQQALTDAGATFTALTGLAAGNALTGADLGGQTLVPGVYHSVAPLAATSVVTFDALGDPNADFIIQGDAALNTTASTSMVLAGGAQASHIFWVLKGVATLGASSSFVGTILSNGGAVTVGASVHFAGRAISLTAAVTLDADIFGPVSAPVLGAAPTVTITGGSTATTSDSTPTITGATDAPTGTVVSVAVGSTTLTTTVQTGGVWTVTVGTALPEGPVTVIASVTPAGSATGTATQVLTIKLAAAVVHHISTIVYFAGNSSVTTSATRTKVAALIKRVPAGALTITVTITGYIKLISPSTVNKALATARTHSVYGLMKSKVHGTYTLKGVGKGLSYATNARRVEVVIYYTLPSRK